jgi:hypothetical protein
VSREDVDQRQTAANGFRTRADRLDEHRKALLSTLSAGADSKMTIYQSLAAVDPIYASAVAELAAQLEAEALNFRERATNIEAGGEVL